MAFIFSCIVSPIQAEESIQKKSSPLTKQDNASDTIFKFEKENETSLLRLKGSGENREEAGDASGVFGLEAFWGQLFLQQGEQSSGYYFVSGKVESDSRQRFNATLGYFPPFLGGEVKATYKVLNGKLKSTVSLNENYDVAFNREFEETAMEQGFGLSYRKRFDNLIKELGVKYLYTHLGGESVNRGPVVIDTTASWRQVDADVGFGDVDNHDISFEVATGSDVLDFLVLQGLRLDLGAGYQSVSYGEFESSTTSKDKGFSGTAELKARTPLGVFRGRYQDSQTTTTAYAGFQYGGTELYYQKTSYDAGPDEELIGISFTFDLYDPAATFSRKSPPFFYASNTGYTSVQQMEHIGGLTNSQFTVKPQIRVRTEEIYSVNKAALPGTVTIDDSKNAIVVVGAGCPLIGVTSVSPSSAASALSVSGRQININLAELPKQQQTIIAKIDDECCGYTQLTIRTGGSGSINSVNVEESVGCQPPFVTQIVPEAPPEAPPEIPFSNP